MPGAVTGMTTDDDPIVGERCRGIQHGFEGRQHGLINHQKADIAVIEQIIQFAAGVLGIGWNHYCSNHRQGQPGHREFNAVGQQHRDV